MARESESMREREKGRTRARNGNMKSVSLQIANEVSISENMAHKECHYVYKQWKMAGSHRCERRYLTKVQKTTSNNKTQQQRNYNR